MTTGRTDDPSATLVRSLARGEAFPHPIDSVRVVETHISWVLLTGQFAYKIKRPVAPGFLDFSTLERRRAACDEELRLNRRLAPQLYLAVVPVTGRHDRPVVGGRGHPIEYAVKMRQFPADALLTDVFRAGRLRDQDLRNFAQAIAAFHEGLEPAPHDTEFGKLSLIRAPVAQSLAQIRTLAAGRTADAVLSKLELRMAARLEAGARWFDERRQQGRVRECHGDLHLGNLVLLDTGIVAFDALEFDPRLRWIDLVSEVSFLAMDLLVRGGGSLAWSFLNTWLQHTGDYEGIRLLEFYLAYRALVRAKVRLLKLSPDRIGADLDGSDPQPDGEVPAGALLRFATVPLPSCVPRLVLMCGVSGSGKSWTAERLAPRLGAVHVRSDIERKRLAGLPALASTQSAPGAGLYTPEASTATYARLAEIADHVLDTGLPVIVDAASLTISQRERLVARARRRAYPTVIVHCDAERALLERRIAARRRAGRDPSEADATILEHQLRSFEPPDTAEADRLIVVDAAADASIDDVVSLIRSTPGP